MGDVIQGPWSSRPVPSRPRGAPFPPPGWRRGGLPGLSRVEDRRAAILDAKPACKVCDVPFKPGCEPRDLLCRDCRLHPAVEEPPPPEGLF